MGVIERIYTTGMYLARGIAPVAARGEGKLARGVRGRRGAVARLEQWATAYRRGEQPLVWFHAPSVGEGLQARAVMEAFHLLRPEAQLAYTFFSPSAEAFAASVPADVADYLPLDTPDDMERLLTALKPAAIVFSKTEVWPNLTAAAAAKGIPVLLLSATLPASSSRLGPIARLLLAPTHRRLAAVAAISAADADRYRTLDVPAERRLIMGDARFDQVWARARAAAGSELVARLRDPDRQSLVAGSTWPADEERLIPAFAGLGELDRTRLIIAPHEPTSNHIEPLEERLRAHGLSWRRLSEAGEGRGDEDVLLVDRVGVLGDLYALADVAYVGGGFGTAGLHSVLEPAAFGAPVLFGPHYSNSREAGELIAVRGAITADDAQALGRALGTWTGDTVLRREAGERARAYVQQGLGAADRGAKLIADLLQIHTH